AQHAPGHVADEERFPGTVGVRPPPGPVAGSRLCLRTPEWLRCAVGSSLQRGLKATIPLVARPRRLARGRSQTQPSPGTPATPPAAAPCGPATRRATAPRSRAPRAPARAG